MGNRPRTKKQRTSRGYPPALRAPVAAPGAAAQCSQANNRNASHDDFATGAVPVSKSYVNNQTAAFFVLYEPVSEFST